MEECSCNIITHSNFARLFHPKRMPRSEVRVAFLEAKPGYDRQDDSGLPRELRDLRILGFRV